MDSITQAALGAAVGEAVLGKKMGNKALLIGAVAGTIPDLDIFSRLFIDQQVYGLIYHRGITHSILFTFVLAPLLAWLSMLYYQKKLYQKKSVQIILATFWGLFYGAIIAAFAYLSYYKPNAFTFISLGSVSLLGVAVFRKLYENIQFRRKTDDGLTFWQWTIMYFLAIMTHWLIDACTAYGTQIFEPFSSYRVAFNNISIVDPLYTVPLLLGLLGAFFAKKYATKRRFWNGLGLGLSTFYMVFTFYSKSLMNQIVADNIESQNITATSFITYPSIFNTILWQTTIETEDAFYYGNYSFFDENTKIEFTKLPKNHELISKYKGNEQVDILLWFANGYYNVTQKEDGTLTFNNLRFGLIDLGELPEMSLNDRYIFRFAIAEKNGLIEISEDRDTKRINPITLAPILWRRIWGEQK